MSDPDIADNGDGTRTIRVTGLPVEVHADAGDTIQVGPYFYAVQLDGTYHLDIRRDADEAPMISAIDGDAAVAEWREDRRKRSAARERTRPLIPRDVLSCGSSFTDAFKDILKGIKPWPTPSAADVATP